MLFSSAVLSICAAAVSALTITGPNSNGWKNGTVTVTWTTASGDPEVFSMELRDTNTPSVISPLAVANNIKSSEGSHSFLLPPVPAANTYQLEFVNVTNINQVYATSGTFPIVNSAQAATSSGAASNTITGTGTGSSSSASATSSAPASATSAAANSAAGLHVPAVAALFLAGVAVLL
ncbi:hypothetical protein BDV93DRAFT_528397 [Ceratobasidium sp. AG-I]|nr:hypothetical protein BDV93DRAFT_528397 [Ceratobasidium sp. AG-I]